MGNVLTDLLAGGQQPAPSADQEVKSYGKRPPSTVDFDDANARPTKRCKIDDSSRSSLDEPGDQDVDMAAAGVQTFSNTTEGAETKASQDVAADQGILDASLKEQTNGETVIAYVAEAVSGNASGSAALDNGTEHEDVANGRGAGMDPSQKVSPSTTETKPMISQATLDWLGPQLKASEVKESWNIDLGKVNSAASATAELATAPNDRSKGLALIKAEYLAKTSMDGDAEDGRAGPKKARGQNFNRRNGKLQRSKGLCGTLALRPEFSPAECSFGDKCRFLHNLREYLESESAKDQDEEDQENGNQDISKGDSSFLSRADMDKCHNYKVFGWCTMGWRCKFVKHHMMNFKHPDGREELVLLRKVVDEENAGKTVDRPVWDDIQLPPTIGNIVPKAMKIKLQRKKIVLEAAETYNKWLEAETRLSDTFHHRRKNQSSEGIEDLRAQFTDPPFRPSEKRRLYFGAETPMLAPLTTQGNLPFRRLCIELGCELTYSEMMYGQQLLQGRDVDWVLLKAHESELSPPKNGAGRPEGYDHGKDLRFGAQMSGAHQRVTTKVASVLSQYCPQLRVIDINCGCPLDAVFKTGAGSALLDTSNKLERVIRGMNAVSGEIPITAKIRTGVHTGRPTATKLIGQLAFGGREHRERLGGPGCAAITLHGRSREQRYTKKADWGYIKECGKLIETYNQAADEMTDTIREADESTQANSSKGRMWFIGNGDCFSHEDYYKHIEHGSVDSVMIGRGALLKPWLYEEIQARQYLDKTGSQRMDYIEKFVNFGLECWGSDSWGINTTRRFLLEWMSFSYRYIPVGILEVLPPDMNDRPPAWIGRDKFESKLASRDVADWNDLADHYLGKTLPDFNFTPKYKSNSYEGEG